MPQIPFSSLLIIDSQLENHPFYKELLRQNIALSEAEILFVASLDAAISLIESRSFELVLLNLFLPDIQGVVLFEKIHYLMPSTAIIAITETPNEELALAVLKMGAEDYLVRNELTAKNLMRAFNYALARQEVREHLRAESFTDDLSRVYNRRGFMALAQQNLSLAKRLKQGFHLFLIDVDHLKEINDTYGHPTGDVALQATVDCLKHSFRNTDIIGRIGGDEFVILAINTEPLAGPQLQALLHQTQERYNMSGAYPFTISMSVGYAYFDPDQPESIQSLIEKADYNLYENKKHRMQKNY